MAGRSTGDALGRLKGTLPDLRTFLYSVDFPNECLRTPVVEVGW